MFITFQITIASSDVHQPYSIAAGLGMSVSFKFTEPLEQPSSRLGLSMLIFANQTIQEEQRFLHRDWLDLGAEDEPGNFLVSHHSLHHATR